MLPDFTKSRTKGEQYELTALRSGKITASGFSGNRRASEVPFVVLGNKIDIPTAASEDELRNALGLYSHMTYGRTVASNTKTDGVRPIELFMVSIKE